MFFFFFSSRRRHTRFDCDWSSDVCSSDLTSDWSSGKRFDLKFAGPTKPIYLKPFPNETVYIASEWRGRTDECLILPEQLDRKSTRLNSSHSQISYAVFCLKKKKTTTDQPP